MVVLIVVVNRVIKSGRWNVQVLDERERENSGKRPNFDRFEKFFDVNPLCVKLSCELLKCASLVKCQMLDTARAKEVA